MNMVVALRLKQKRKERQNFDAFRKQITTPAALPFSMPAAGRLHVSVNVEVLEPLYVIKVGSRELYVPAGDADTVHPIGYFEQAQLIELSSTLPDLYGLVVYVEDPFGRTHKIGEK